MATCSPDYTDLGMQSGEEIATTLRLVALCISISVFFPWISPGRRKQMRVFFLHWMSGVVYVLTQFIMSVMVLNCWSSKGNAGPVIYMLKFLELVVLNLWSISSLAIAVLIASIVQSFTKLRRVPPVIGSTRTAIGCVTAAFVATVLSASFWNDIKVTGGYFWVTNSNNVNQARWISLSFGATQTLAGILMAAVLIFTITGERKASLRVCCKSSQRVYFHYILTIFGTCVYVYNGIALMCDEFSDMKISKRLVIIGWCSRYVHVVADTAIIFGAFKALEARERTELEGKTGSTRLVNGLVPSHYGRVGSGRAPLPRPSPSSRVASIRRFGGQENAGAPISGAMVGGAAGATPKAAGYAGDLQVTPRDMTAASSSGHSSLSGLDSSISSSSMSSSSSNSSSISSASDKAIGTQRKGPSTSRNTGERSCAAKSDRISGQTKGQSSAQPAGQMIGPRKAQKSTRSASQSRLPSGVDPGDIRSEGGADVRPTVRKSRRSSSSSSISRRAGAREQGTQKFTAKDPYEPC